jgi:hypothetical protein
VNAPAKRFVGGAVHDDRSLQKKTKPIEFFAAFFVRMPDGSVSVVDYLDIPDEVAGSSMPYTDLDGFARFDSADDAPNPAEAADALNRFRRRNAMSQDDTAA